MSCDFRECLGELAKVFVTLIEVINQLSGCLFLHDPGHEHLPLSLIGGGATAKWSSKKGDPNRGL